MHRRALLAAVACLVLLAGQPVLAGETLEVEPNHTSVGFSIPIAGGLTRVTGKFTEFQISLTYEGDDPLANVASWTLEAVITTASIDTGIETRDKHLRTPDFFAAETYPEITFRSERIEGSNNEYIAFGELDMHGIKRPLELPFTFTGTVGNQVTGASMVGAIARTTLLRSDYDIASDFKHTHIVDFLGDEIEVEIFCWLRPKKQTETDSETE